MGAGGTTRVTKILPLYTQEALDGNYYTDYSEEARSKTRWNRSRTPFHPYWTSCSKTSDGCASSTANKRTISRLKSPLSPPRSTWSPETWNQKIWGKFRVLTSVQGKAGWRSRQPVSWEAGKTRRDRSESSNPACSTPSAVCKCGRHCSSSMALATKKIPHFEGWPFSSLFKLTVPDVIISIVAVVLWAMGQKAEDSSWRLRASMGLQSSRVNPSLDSENKPKMLSPSGTIYIVLKRITSSIHNWGIGSWTSKKFDSETFIKEFNTAFWKGTSASPYKKLTSKPHGENSLEKAFAN